MKTLITHFRKSSLIIAVCLLIFQDVSAQFKELKIGDSVPPLTFLNAYNYRTKRVIPIKLSDLKGKLVILDFWGTFCEPCLEEFPQLDSLQRIFRGKIQIITVNPQSADQIDRFFKLHTAVFRPDLPFIRGEKSLEKLFPHMGVPFQVWIDQSGKVLHLADSYNLTAENIQNTLQNKSVKMRITAKNVYPEGLFEEKWKSLIVFSSYISRFGVDSGLHLEAIDHRKGITEGGPIVFLYQRAFDEMTNHQYGLFRPGRILLKVKDSTRYISNETGENYMKWIENNSYWYQLLVPDNYKGNVPQLMIEDLRRYFNLKASIQEKTVDCWVLIKTTNKDKIKTKGGIARDDLRPSQLRASLRFSSKREMINKPYKSFSNEIQGMLEVALKLPFQDSTGYSGNVDIQFNGDVLDHANITSLRNELKRYDLDLMEKPCLLNVLVLEENN